MRSTTRAVPLVLVLLLLIGSTACGSGHALDRTEGTGGSGAPTRKALDGRTFLSTSVAVAGAARPMAGTEPINLQFRGDRLSADAGCNSTSGTYSLDGESLVAGDLMTTAMGCDGGPLEAQDAWFRDLLAAGPTLDLAGDQVTMTSGDTVIVFVDRETADPDRPLVGPTWTLETILDGAVASSIPAGATATLTVPTATTIRWTACNQWGGALADVSHTGFTVQDITSTLMACAGDQGRVDDAMSTVLTGPVTYEIEGPVLRLRNGDKGLDLRTP